MPKRTVLVPLDDSELSRTILPRIQGFFPPEGWDVVLFRAEAAPRRTSSRVLPVPQVVVAGEYGPGILAAGADEGTETLAAGSEEGPESIAEAGWARFRQVLRQELDADLRGLARGGYSVSVAVHFGPDPVRELVRYAGESAVDLLAIATHGRTGLGRLLDRSVVRDVLRRLTIPVFLIRASNGAAPVGVDRTDAHLGTAAPAKPATLAGLKGFGLLTVRRAREGDIVEASGYWWPENRQAKLHRLEHALDAAAPVTFEGPISDPASGGVEIDEAATQVYLTGIHHYSGDDGRAHSTALFVVPDVLSHPADPEGTETGTRVPRHE